MPDLIWPLPGLRRSATGGMQKDIPRVLSYSLFLLRQSGFLVKWLRYWLVIVRIR